MHKEMENLKIIQIKDSANEFLPQVEQQFAELYSFMKDKGLKLNLVEDGEKKWMNSIKKTIGKFVALFVVLDGKKVAGFVSGIVKFTPDYLGNQKVGLLSYHFVDKDYRGKGIGKSLLKSLETWFKEKNISSIEVQASFINEYSRKYFEKNGYENELVQLRKFVKK